MINKLLEISDLSLAYGQVYALRKFSCHVEEEKITALVGSNGAGKTTLLDVLAHRTTMGVITGDMLVNGTPLDASFQRKTGYVQQQGKPQTYHSG